MCTLNRGLAQFISAHLICQYICALSHKVSSTSPRNFRMQPSSVVHVLSTKANQWWSTNAAQHDSNQIGVSLLGLTLCSGMK